jgi:hypothetical protein
MIAGNKDRLVYALEVQSLFIEICLCEQLTPGPWLLKFFGQILQVSNLPHEVNSNVLLNIFISFKCWLSVRIGQQ